MCINVWPLAQPGMRARLWRSIVLKQLGQMLETDVACFTDPRTATALGRGKMWEREAAHLRLALRESGAQLGA